MDLSFVRHGQSMGNVAGHYTTAAHDQLSPLGWDQAHELAGRLADRHFDAIYSSPITRAAQTITPFLRDSGRTAELWPELAEACYQEDPHAPSPERLGSPPPLRIPDDLAPHFTLRNDEPHMPWPDETFREGEARVRLAGAELVRRHGGTDDQVLVVAHRLSGCVLLEALLGITPSRTFDHDNAAMSRLVEGPDGRFSIAFLNRS